MGGAILNCRSKKKLSKIKNKKIRTQRKNREDSIGVRAGFLEKENALLRAQLSNLREEKNSLQTLLVIRRQIFQQKQQQQQQQQQQQLQQQHQQQQQQQFLSQDQVLGLLMLEHQQRQFIQLQQRLKENMGDLQVKHNFIFKPYYSGDLNSQLVRYSNG